jgi:hypothetical protein
MVICAACARLSSMATRKASAEIELFALHADALVVR